MEESVVNDVLDQIIDTVSTLPKFYNQEPITPVETRCIQNTYEIMNAYSIMLQSEHDQSRHSDLQQNFGEDNGSIDCSSIISDRSILSNPDDEVIKDNTTHNVFNESKFNIDDLLQTYGKLYSEKLDIENILKETVEKMKIRNNQLFQMEEKLHTIQEDNEYLRTENTKIKNQMKQMNENNFDNVAEVTATIEVCNPEFHAKILQEFHNLHRELAEFRKLMYNEIDLLKANKIDSATSNTSGSSSSTSCKDLSEVDNATFLQSSPICDLNKMDINTPRTSNILNIVPGIKQYSKAHIQSTLLLSDSVIGKMNSKNLKYHLDLDCEDVIVNKHSGATAVELAHYCTLPLSQIRPSQVIIFAGSNDISRAYRDKTLNEYEVVNNILQIAKNAADAGVKKIFVSSILERWGHHFKNIILRVNQILEDRCRVEGYFFLDHSDVTTKHLCRDGLHTNNYGHVILKMNVLRCFNTFNPFICDFENFYEKALFL